MYYESGALYPANMYGYECNAAKNLVSLLTAEQEEQDIAFLLAEAQKELGMMRSASSMPSISSLSSSLVSPRALCMVMASCHPVLSAILRLALPLRRGRPA